MQKKDLYDALSGIDEKFLSDSENFSEISAEFRRSKVRKISTVSSLCGCSLILAVVFLNYSLMNIDSGNIPETIEKSSTFQTDISDNTSNDYIITTDIKTYVRSITETTENNSDCPAPAENTVTEIYIESSEESVTAHISDIIDNDSSPVSEPFQTEISVIETSEISSTDFTIPADYDNITDGCDISDFLGMSVDEWLENSNVVWSESDTKGYLNSEYIPMGSIKISEKLSDLMQNNPDNAVYAVMVDFSSCIDENELLNWAYNGYTIADLKQQISEVTEYSENSYTYVDGYGTEHVEYFLTSESEKQVAEIEVKINEIKSAYRDSKIQDFRNSFNDNGLEIYTDRISGIQEENFCFYTFAEQKHLEEFKCKNNEAFIFYPANYFK